MTHTGNPRTSSIALSISGGGHRAAAFGLGTIALLQELQLMEKVGVISTVSGGSLVGSFYLCAKARSIGEAVLAGQDIAVSLASWQNEGFRSLFFEPFRTFLHSRNLAEQLVKELLPLSLDPREKLIRSAAERVHSLLDQHDYPSRLGDKALLALLKSHKCLPDHVFFNAANLTSLDLFRFGVTRDGVDKHDSFVVNNVLIPVDPNPSDPVSELAAGLRIADCVAASFCFPLGFEPLVFPDDFLEVEPTLKSHEQQQREAIVRRLCHGHRAVALMDGGLYDNLGLASLEVAIRAIREEETKCLGIDPSKADPRRQQIYVLATDVDNIQPANKSLDPHKPTQPKSGPPLPGLTDWLKALPSMSGLLLSPLMVLGVFGTLPLVFLLWLTAKMPLLRSPLLRWLQKSPRFGRPLLELGIVLSPELIAAAAGPPTSPKALKDVGHLWVGRRLDELLPAFNGYLKRTRNLTYQFLSYKYKSFGGGNPNTFLLRNLIFQLAPGRDCDPATKLDELTRPLEPYANQASQECLDPDSWIQAKLQAIEFLTLELHTPPMNVDAKLFTKLETDLALNQARLCWSQIMAVMENPANPAALATGSTMVSLLQPVALAVQQAWRINDHSKALVGQQLLSRICEMATNLPTTLWLEDYCFYVPSQYDPMGDSLVVQGRWFVDASLIPTNTNRKEQKPGFLDFKVGQAVDLAIAAGVINTCFNILEFSASVLKPSSQSAPNSQSAHE
jgi:predicted acylesterase/phospholipase RssA